MRLAPVWNEHRDAQLKKLRFEGLSWLEIAARLEMSVEKVMARAELVKARDPLAAKEVGRDISNDRMPLYAGHPDSWDTIIKGTMLEGTEYPEKESE